MISRDHFPNPPSFSGAFYCMRFRHCLHELPEAGHQDVELGLRGAGCAVDPSDEELETQRAHVPSAVRRRVEDVGRGG